MIDTAARPKRQLTILLVVAAAVIAGVNAIDALPVGVFYDDAMYAILGKSLSQGDGYRYLNLPGHPSATHYPPGYPMLLAILWRISPDFPGNIALFKMTNALLLGVVAFWTYRFGRERFEWNERIAAVTALASTVTIPALVLSSSVMSEVLFLALLLPYLLRAERGVTAPRVRTAALLGAGAALLFYVRAHAIVLIPALALAYGQIRAWRAAAAATATGAVLLTPWFVWTRVHDGALAAPLRGSYGSYAGWLLDGLRFEGVGLLLSAARVNLATCAEILARSFSLGRNPVLDTLAVVAVLLLCGAGVAAWVTRARVSLLFLALYMAMVLVWPFSPLRFVWGAWPLFVVLMVSGVAYLLTARARSRWRSRLPVLGVVAAAIVTLGTLNFNVRGYVNHWWATVGRSIAPRIQPQLQWTVTHTDSADVIAAEDEGAVYLYTGREAVPVAAFSTRQYFRERAPEESATDLANILVALHPKYVIAWAVPTMRAASLLAAAKPPLLQQIDSIPGGRVFRRVPSP